MILEWSTAHVEDSARMCTHFNEQLYKKHCFS